MKKKKAKTNKPKRKQKIDVVLGSLLNLEYRVKELIKSVERLERQQYFNPNQSKDSNAQEKKEWPNDYPYRYDGISWKK
jgi:hypothetical protein